VRVLAGEHIALRCPGCPTPLQHGCCHSLVLAAAVAQRCSISLETDAGPPADPVTAPPRVAYGLDLEAAKMHKWHLGGCGIWTGVGMSATALVTWVPQSKAARCLVEISDVLDGRCEVARYRSLHGALADARALGESSTRLGTMPRAADTSRMSSVLLRLAASCSSILSPKVCSIKTSRCPSCSCFHSGCRMMVSCVTTSSDALAPRESAPPSRRARAVR
jgi:hypothetical protein